MSEGEPMHLHSEAHAHGVEQARYYVGSVERGTDPMTVATMACGWADGAREGFVDELRMLQWGTQGEAAGALQRAEEALEVAAQRVEDVS